LKILLDTTYFLPAIGITIKEVPKDAPITLYQKGNQTSVCDISIFELSAKGAKHINQKTLSPQRVTRGIKAIIHSEQIEIIPTYETQTLLTAFQLRSTLTDFIDCLILSSAINHCDTLITEDNDIKNLTKNKKFNKLLTATNPNFKIQTLTETL
jgi:PIN domain nuclease of toxin-antitoxin system